MSADDFYPQAAAARGRVEPAPRRVRGYLGDALVFDTTAARYVWEIPYYPQYYIPLTDVDMAVLHDENHSQRVQFGPSRLHSLVAGGRIHQSAARVFDGESDSPVAGLVRFEWNPLRWFEEDEPIYGHPRNPYSRVDALRSHRHVRIELDATTLADTACPVLLFETGLPTRYYIDPTDVDFSNLEPSSTQTRCPYKGVTSGYWSVRTGPPGEPVVHADVAWTYHYPLPAVAQIAGMVAFYNERLDIVVDGVSLQRPRTQFS